MNATNYFERQMIGFMFGNVDPALGNYEVGLLTNLTFVDGNTPTEHSGDGYARVPINNDVSVNGWNAAPGSGDGIVTNQKTLAFPTATGTWADVYFIGIFAASGGQLLAYVPITGGPISVTNGTQLTINSGTLELELD